MIFLEVVSTIYFNLVIVMAVVCFLTKTPQNTQEEILTGIHLGVIVRVHYWFESVGLVFVSQKLFKSKFTLA